MSPEPKINPDLRLAEAFGHYVERWAAEHRAPAAVCAMVRRAAVHLSTATSTGHVCLYLSGLAASLTAEDARVITPGELREALLESGLVGSPRSPGARPLILDGDNRLYLHRYFDYESRLARCLVQRRGRVSPAPGGLLPPNVVALLNALFPQPADAPAQADWQKIAVLTALLSKLTIVSGGPGTGKTTALVKLLACLLEANPACRIALAAPTGKAAARITETIRQRSAQLPGELAALLPPTSSTVHRLLGVLPDGGFRHHAGNPLPIDVLIVDEASMLDLALAARLFEAVPPAARIILVGDKDQLAAVESGAVFAELSADPTLSAERIALLARLGGIEPAAIQTPRPAGSPGLTDSVVWLRQNYRFGSGSAIGRLAEEINAGDADAALTRLRAASDPALTWRNDGGAALEQRKGLLIEAEVLAFLGERMTNLDLAAPVANPGGQQRFERRDVIVLRRLRPKVRTGGVGLVIGGIERDHAVEVRLGLRQLPEVAPHRRPVVKIARLRGRERHGLLVGRKRARLIAGPAVEAPDRIPHAGIVSGSVPRRIGGGDRLGYAPQRMQTTSPVQQDLRIEAGQGLRPVETLQRFARVPEPERERAGGHPAGRIGRVRGVQCAAGGSRARQVLSRQQPQHLLMRSVLGRDHPASLS